MAAHAARRGLQFLVKGILPAAPRSIKTLNRTAALTGSSKFSSAGLLTSAYCHHSTMSKAFVQQAAPHFQGTAVTTNGDFKDIKLSDYKGKYLVFFFYPLDFTFVCPTEIIAFSDRADEFRVINCEVLACSVDSHFSHLAWTSQDRKKGGLGKMKIPILSDIKKEISRDYGVLLEDQGISLRGLFIIDDKGILRQITVNDLPVGRSVDETLRLVQAFQFTDKHGEVCPAGWKPGSDTIKPDVQKSQEFFSKQ
ncbi:peroxiredoxin-1-like [Rhopilema esculentum]|uniref:peroxiredoxin-1-like n=1 Tax=Rhopilema esculentum TaxID=499914 RepID=UPI0031DF254C|eukprot:gene4501-20748_t